MTLLTISGRLRAAVQRRRRIAGPYRIPRVVFLVVAFGISASLAAADPAKHLFNIEAKPATQSLTDYARQAHTQLGYDVDMVEDILTNAVVGEYDSAEALELLLADTGLAAEYGERGIFIRRIAKREVGGDIEKRTPPLAEANSLRLTQTAAAGAQATVTQNQTSRRTESESGEGENKRRLEQIEEIIVTGTNIRGIAPESSPVRIFTSEDIQNSGAATAQDFIQTLTANFGGGSNPEIPGLPNDRSASFNTDNGSFGSSVNLRGLGSGSTLVLLNGHRLAPSSGIGDFVDISMIPASALERVDVLSDGASSIYGADAVAGVVNFVLRDDYDGVETSYRRGTATEGNVDENRASITGGKNWAIGNALFSYEFYDRTNLSSGDRSFSQDAPLPNDLLPSQRRHSVLATISQGLTPNLKLFGDLSFSNRQAEHRQTELSGSSSLRTPEARILSVAAGGTWDAFRNWLVDLSGTYSRLEQHVLSLGSIDRESNVNSHLWSADAKASGTVFSMPGGHVKLAVGGHYREENFTQFLVGTSTLQRDAERSVKALFGEAFIPIFGPENAVQGIKRFEINVSARFGNFSDFGTTANPKVGVLWSPFNGMNLRASYGTSFKPPPLGRVGAADLFAQSYPSAFVNSVFGVIAPDPIADVVIITMSGTAKNLDAEKSRTFTGGLDFAANWNRHNVKGAVTYFDIDFKDRLGSTPVPQNRSPFDVPNIAFVSPDAFPPGTVIFFPSAEQIQEALDSADTVLGLFGTDPLDAEVITFTGMVRNLSVSVARGLDFNISDTYESDIGDFLFGFEGTFLVDFQQQAAATTPLVEHVNTRFNPVDLKLRGRAGYSQNGLFANLFVNYMNDYRVDNTPDASPIESWTTVDISLAYDTQDHFDTSLLSNTVLRLSVRNLFDENPPSAPSFPSLEIFGFDPTNASPLNRFIAVELTKRF